jgi:hypothetical protein
MSAEGFERAVEMSQLYGSNLIDNQSPGTPILLLNWNRAAVFFACLLKR